MTFQDNITQKKLGGKKQSIITKTSHTFFKVSLNNSLEKSYGKSHKLHFDCRRLIEIDN